jgi:hypothetical protein
MTTNRIPCPYCEHTIAFGHYAIIAQRQMADHKAKCTQRRYLGGALSTENIPLNANPTAHA